MTAEGALKIKAEAADVRWKISGGVLNLIDNSIDWIAGTVKLKRSSINADLRPGQFVDAHVALSCGPPLSESARVSQDRRKIASRLGLLTDLPSRICRIADELFGGLPTAFGCGPSAPRT